MSDTKESLETSLLLRSLALGESVIVPRKIAAIPEELKELFNLERGMTKDGFYNRKGLITYRINKDLIRARYQCLVGEDMLRIFFSGEYQEREVILDIYDQKFKLSVKGKFDQENIPTCDPPVRVLASASDSMLIVHKAKGQLDVQSVRLIRTGPDQEYPIYIRPINNSEIITTATPDWSIRDVQSFSPQALLLIMDQIDPRIGKNVGFPGDGEFQLRPKIRPAIEMAQLIGENLN